MLNRLEGKKHNRLFHLEQFSILGDKERQKSKDWKYRYNSISSLSEQTNRRRTYEEKKERERGRERESTADDVPEMRDVVDVRQRAGNEDVALPLDRKFWRRPTMCGVVWGIRHC